MKKILLYVILILLFSTTSFAQNIIIAKKKSSGGLTCTQGSGDSVLFSHSMSSANMTSYYSDVRWKALYFTIANDVRFTRITLVSANTSASAKNTTVEIWNVSTYPTSIANANATVTVAVPNTTATSINFDFASPFTLSAGTYAIVVQGVSGTDTGTGLGYDAESPTIGSYYSTTNSGGTWTINSSVNVHLIIKGCQ
jgi:hypothetical protein